MNLPELADSWKLFLGDSVSDDDLTVDSILGDGGAISRRLENYEPRPQQLAMARKVAEALSEGKHLIAEAGTGTGKSFAYLIPAILHATSDQSEAVPTSRQEQEEGAQEKRSPR
ncbi:MAG: DEAD/DEAH box helicase, partial [Planctomycetota bacterium]